MRSSARPVLEFRYLPRRESGLAGTAGPLRHLPQADRRRSDEANMKAIPRKQRAMVRKGIQNGLRSEIDRDVERLAPRLRRERAQSRHAGLLATIFPACCRGFPGASRHRHDARTRTGRSLR